MRERRRIGRPPKLGGQPLGPGRYARLSLELEAAVELMRLQLQEQRLAQGDSKAVDSVDAIRKLVEEGAIATGLIERPKPPKKPAR